MNVTDYKIFHENFMKNNNGTNFWDVSSVIIPTSLTTFLMIVIFLIVYNFKSKALRYIIEFIILVLPVILSVTILSNKLNVLIATLFAINLPIFIKLILDIFSSKCYVELSSVEVPSGNREFISIIRAIINLLTAICILAVDFQIFPRKFAKTENYGFSLMDTGVGLYVFGNAIIAPEIYKKKSIEALKHIKTQLISTVPLLILGLSRFIIVNEIDYQQHISEYGVHWNFFITLAITKLLGTMLLLIIPYNKILFFGLCVSLLQEILLNNGLSEWVLSDIKRDTFLTANREGITSILGYVALYLISIHLGEILYVKDNKIKSNITCVITLTSYSMLLIASTIIYHNHFGVSRRLANFGYVIFVLSLSVSMSIVFLLMEIFFIIYFKFKNQAFNATDYIPTIYKSINYNGLLFFLIANIGTGLINLSMKTLLIQPVASIFIITIYMLLICSIVQVLMIKNIKLKVW